VRATHIEQILIATMVQFSAKWFAALATSLTAIAVFQRN
jgi:hypothetical protein